MRVLLHSAKCLLESEQKKLQRNDNDGEHSSGSGASGSVKPVLVLGVLTIDDCPGSDVVA